MTDNLTGTSDLPPAEIRYHEVDPSGNSLSTTTYAGSYDGFDHLPFGPDSSMGIVFTMDNMKFAIDGDLSGQCVYHRVMNPSTLYHMPWESFVDLLAKGEVDLEKFD